MKHNGLELGRFSAALVVVLYHNVHFLDTFEFDSVALRNFFISSFTWGHLGVQVFFLFSGFVMSLNYFNLISNHNISFKKFIALRFWRLYPLHCFVLIIVLLFQYLISQRIDSYFVYQNNFEYSTLFCHLTLTQWLSVCGPFGLNAPSWSIGVEFYMYVLFFLIISFPSLRKKYSLFIITLLLILINKIYFNLFVASFSYFMIGVLYHQYDLFKISILNFLLNFLIFIVGIILGINMFIITGIVFLYLLISADLGSLNSLAMKLGKLSYPLYISHFLSQLIFYFLMNTMQLNLTLLSYACYLALLFMIMYFVNLLDNFFISKRGTWYG